MQPWWINRLIRWLVSIHFGIHELSELRYPSRTCLQTFEACQVLCPHVAPGGSEVALIQAAVVKRLTICDCFHEKPASRPCIINTIQCHTMRCNYYYFNSALDKHFFSEINYAINTVQLFVNGMNIDFKYLRLQLDYLKHINSVIHSIYKKHADTNKLEIYLINNINFKLKGVYFCLQWSIILVSNQLCNNQITYRCIYFS